MRTNDEIAIHLQQISHLFTKTKRPGDNYRSQAFSKAANQVRAQRDAVIFDGDGKLNVDIAGVGDAIRDIINEFANTGDSDKMRKLRALVPNEVIDRFDAKVCKRKVNELLKPLTDAGIDWQYAGSMRRGQSTVRDVDVVVCLHNEVDERALITSVLNKAGLKPDIRDGEQKIGVSIPIASQGRSFTLDLNFCYPENRGAYLVYYTGPKTLNIEMRAAAKAKGWKLNQYGVFDENDKCIASRTEAQVFAVMAMDYIEPENRA